MQLVFIFLVIVIWYVPCYSVMNFHSQRCCILSFEFGYDFQTEDREKFKTVSNHAKYGMEGVKERYGKTATEEVEYEEGEVEYDRAGGVINCRV